MKNVLVGMTVKFLVGLFFLAMYLALHGCSPAPFMANVARTTYDPPTPYHKPAVTPYHKPAVTSAFDGTVYSVMRVLDEYDIALFDAECDTGIFPADAKCQIFDNDRGLMVSVVTRDDALIALGVHIFGEYGGGTGEGTTGDEIGEVMGQLYLAARPPLAAVEYVVDRMDAFEDGHAMFDGIETSVSINPEEMQAHILMTDVEAAEW